MEQNWSISHEWTIDEVVRARERGLKEYELCSVSWALSAVSRWDEAELVAEAISDPEERNQALGLLAQYLVRAGDVDRGQRAVLFPRYAGWIHDHIREQRH